MLRNSARSFLAGLTKLGVEAHSRRFLSSLAFFSLAALNVFMFTPHLAGTFRLPSLVLMSPFLDWTVWVASGSAFAWICIALARSEMDWLLYLGCLALAGSVLQVLPTVLPKYGPLLTLGWVGGFLMSCATVVSTLACVRRSREVFSIPSARAAGLFLKSLFALVIPLQIWSIATMSPLATASRDFPQLNVFEALGELFRLLTPVTVVFFVLLMTVWLWCPLITRLARGRLCRGTVQRLATAGGAQAFECWRLMVGFSVLVGIFVSSYQWSRGYPLGYDARFYSSVLHGMKATGPQAAFSTERPFLFLVLYSIQSVLGLEPPLLLRLVPVGLAIILVVATYFFTRFVGGTERTSAIAAAFAAVSPRVTVGVEYYLIANWVGVLLMMLFLWAFLKIVSQRSVLWALSSIAVSGLVLGVHYFTWIFMILTVVGHLALKMLETRFSRLREMAFPIAEVLGCIAVLAFALLFVSLVGGELLASLRLAEHMAMRFLTTATPMNFVAFLLDQERISVYFGAEHYAIPLLYVLALVGFVRLNGVAGEKARIVRSWLIVSCVGVLLVRYNEWWRFLYMIPFETLGAFGFTALIERVGLVDDIREMRVGGDNLPLMGLLLVIFFLFSTVLMFSSVPSSVMLLSLVAVAFVELRSPLRQGWGGTIYLLVTFLFLEQLARALWALT